MRLATTIVVTLLVLLAVAWAVTRPRTLEPSQPPPIPTQSLLPFPPNASRVNVTLSLRIDSLEALINDTVSRTLRSGRNWVRRGRIQLDREQAHLRVRSRITDGSYDRGWQWPEVYDIEANIAAESRPRIENEWRVKANVSELSITGIDAKMLWIPVGWIPYVRSRIRSRIRSELNDVVPRMESRVSRTIEDKMRQAWNYLCSDYVVRPDLGLQMTIHPKTIYTEQPRIRPTSIRLALGVEGDVRVSSDTTSNASRQCRFPSSAHVTELAAGEVAFLVPGEITYRRLSEVLTDSIRGKSFGRLIEVTVDSLAVQPHGPFVLIRADVMMRKPGWFGARAKGAVYVWGVPRIDRESQELGLTIAGLDTESRHAIARVIGEFSERWIYDAFSRRLIELRPHMERIGERVDSTGTWSTAGLEGEFALDSIEVVDVQIGAEYLRFVAEGAGALFCLVTCRCVVDDFVCCSTVIT